MHSAREAHEARTARNFTQLVSQSSHPVLLAASVAGPFHAPEALLCIPATGGTGRELHTHTARGPLPGTTAQEQDRSQASPISGCRCGQPAL